MAEKSRRRKRSETRRKREYGRFTVAYERTRNSNMWHVADRDGNRFETGLRDDGRRKAQALASALDTAGYLDMNDLPDERPSKYGDVSTWEEWAAESQAVPVRLAAAGKAAIAGYLTAVYDAKPEYLTRDLGVSEQTIRQYLTDLRADRR